MKTKLCLFIGHEYHERTLSSEFFKFIVRNIFDETISLVLPSNSSITSDLIQTITERDVDVIVLWQMESLSKPLERISKAHQIIVPMYDGARQRPAGYWRMHRRATYIAFSNAMHNMILGED